MNPLESILKAYISSLASELREIVESGKEERMGFIIVDLQKTYPFASGLIKSLFVGTPQEVVDKVSRYWPEFKQFPGSVEFAARVQAWLQREWNRPRGKPVQRKALEGKR
jgi:hypothetical protein